MPCNGIDLGWAIPAGISRFQPEGRVEYGSADSWHADGHRHVLGGLLFDGHGFEPGASTFASAHPR